MGISSSLKKSCPFIEESGERQIIILTKWLSRRFRIRFKEKEGNFQKIRKELFVGRNSVLVKRKLWAKDQALKIY